MAGQSSSKVVAKKITQLKKLVSQLQGELENNAKEGVEDKERSLDELKISMTTKFEEEKRNLEELHAWELEELQEKIEMTFQ